MSYTKIMLAREVLSSDLPDDPDLADRLVRYFPTPLRTRYADQIREHRLSREIITTVLVNDFVNKAGITCYHRLSSETGASVADLIRAEVAARLIFGAADSEAAIVALDHQIPAAVQTDQRLEVRTLVERATPLAGQQPTATDRHQRDRRLLRRSGRRAVRGAARPAVRPGRRGVRQGAQGLHGQGRPGRAGQPDRGAAVPVPGPDHRADRGPGRRRRRGRGQRALLARPAARSGPAARAGSSSCPARPLGDHGARRAARRPARRAGRARRGGHGRRPGRFDQAADRVPGRRRPRGCRSRSRPCARSATANRIWPRPRSGLRVARGLLPRIS